MWRSGPVYDPDGCPVCQDFDLAEEEAERFGDLSGAVDWRVLRGRHQRAEHPSDGDS